MCVFTALYTSANKKYRLIRKDDTYYSQRFSNIIDKDIR